MITENSEYLGVALKNPVALSSGKAVLSRGKSILDEALMELLNTPIGSRFFLPEYGCRLEELLFEPNDAVLESLFRMFVFESIEKWEKRIKFVDLSLEFYREVINAKVTYRVLAVNEIDSFVFPFYRSLKY